MADDADDLYGDLDEATPQLASEVALGKELAAVVGEREALEAQLATLKSDNLSRRAQIEDLTQRACVLLATARLEIKRKEEQLQAAQNKRRHR